MYFSINLVCIQRRIVEKNVSFAWRPLEKTHNFVSYYNPFLNSPTYWHRTLFELTNRKNKNKYIQKKYRIVGYRTIKSERVYEPKNNFPRGMKTHLTKTNDQGSDFLAFASYHRVQMKKADWAINLFYSPCIFYCNFSPILSILDFKYFCSSFVREHKMIYFVFFHKSRLYRTKTSCVIGPWEKYPNFRLVL